MPRAQTKLRAAVGEMSFIFLALLFTSRPARADPATDARIHFQTGVAFIQRGKIKEALERFLMANRLAPNPNIVFNIALCLDRLNRRDEAFVYYRELLQQKDLATDDRSRARLALAKILPYIARLSVVTEPPGVTIYVDRKALGAFGESPRVLAVKPGRRQVLVEKQGYEPASTWVSTANGRQVEARLTLKQIVGTLRVSTSVPGAEIRVDDQTRAAVGRTPHSLTMAPGAHTVFLRAQGYWPTQLRVVIKANETRRLSLVLKALPPPTGTLRIDTNIMGALVMMDGKNLGITPLLRRDVRAGRHRITVFSKGYYQWSGRFALPPDGEAQVAVQLERVPRRKKRGPWPWIMLGLTGAALIAGATMWGLAASNHGRYEDATSPSMDDLQLGQRYNIAADVLLGSTAATGLATALSFILLKPDPDRPSTGQIRVSKAGATAPRKRRVPEATNRARK